MRSKHSTSPIAIQPWEGGYSVLLRGPAAHAVHNMGPNVPLDMILKKFTIIHGM